MKLLIMVNPQVDELSETKLNLREKYLSLLESENYDLVVVVAGKDKVLPEIRKILSSEDVFLIGEKAENVLSKLGRVLSGIDVNNVHILGTNSDDELLKCVDTVSSLGYPFKVLEKYCTTSSGTCAHHMAMKVIESKYGESSIKR